MFGTLVCLWSTADPLQRAIVSLLKTSGVKNVGDDIEVHYDSKPGEVFLSCGSEAFARLREAVLVEAQVAEVVDSPVTNVRLIEIVAAPSLRPPKRWHDRLALLGCGLAGFVIMFVFIAGIGTIVSWFR
jgi:hypothetical protein